MSAETHSGSWIPLMEYANKNGVSLSTLRRRIKAEKIRFRKEGGKYLLWDETSFSSNPEPSSNPILAQAVDAQTGARSEILSLEEDLKKARTEIVELKTLIALYEEQIQSPSP